MKDYYYLYEKCMLCPQKCGVNRIKGETGFCGAGVNPGISCAVLHKGEEPPVSGRAGSGAVFFTGCTLKCCFCQNFSISRGLCGREAAAEELAEIFTALQDAGAQNINLVTASHYLPSVIEAVEIAQSAGLLLPVLWNTSGYETLETVSILESFVDVFLPDIKTLDLYFSEKYFCSKDYHKAAPAALINMARARPLSMKTAESEDILKTGTIIRHLVIPGELESTEKVFKWYSENLMDKAVLSVMFQYTPDYHRDRKLPEVKCNYPLRRVSVREIDQVYEMLDRYSIEEGFIQEQEKESCWLPDFEKLKPFPGAEKEPVWHWKSGFNQDR